MSKSIRVYRRVVGTWPDQYVVWDELDMPGITNQGPPGIVYPLSFAEARERVVDSSRRMHFATNREDYSSAFRDNARATMDLDALEKED